MTEEQFNEAGGPAFPLQGFPEYRGPHTGMTLRDWFASQAITGLIANTNHDIRNTAQLFKETPEKLVASMAYEVADAMLNVRERNFEIREIPPKGE